MYQTCTGLAYHAKLESCKLRNWDFSIPNYTRSISVLFLPSCGKVMLSQASATHSVQGRRGVSMPGPMSLPRGGYFWYQVPSGQWVYQRGWVYHGEGHVTDWVGIPEGDGCTRRSRYTGYIEGTGKSGGMGWVYQVDPPPPSTNIQLWPPKRVVWTLLECFCPNLLLTVEKKLALFAFLLSISFIYFVNTIKLKVTTALTSHFS